MKEIVVALIGLIGGVLSAVLGAHWFSPDLVRFDVFFPTKEVSILDDFVFVYVEFYKERGSGPALETYRNPYTKVGEPVFDKARYVEHVWLRKTAGQYTIRLASSGLPPEIRAISPPLKNPKHEVSPAGTPIMTADLDLDQSQEFQYSGTTPNPKTIYIYRNGLQGTSSSGGKNVVYNTDRVTFVYDFSSLPNWEGLFRIAPQVCLKRALEEQPLKLDVKWRDGVAIAEAFKLKRGDRMRIFWTWARQTAGAPEFPEVTCEKALE